MKNNLISAIAGWKSAALLALVAMVAAVAFSGVLTSTQTADAAENTDGTDIAAEGVAGGTKVYTNSVNASLVTYTIADSSSASGKFTHSSAQNNGQTIACNGAAATDTGFAASCDKDDGSSVQVELQVDKDSPAGNIIITVSAIGPDGTTTTTTDFVRVFKAPIPTRLVVSAPTKTAAADDGPSVITVTLKDENDANIVDAKVNVVTTNGTLDGDEVLSVNAIAGEPPTLVEGEACTGDQSCQLTMGTAGARVTLTGSDRPGTATVTFNSGELSSTAEIVLYGPPVSISAETEQGSIEVGGGTNIVVTVIDAGGNPVAGTQVAVAAGATGVVGPERLAQKVSVVNNIDKDVDGDQAVDKGDLPACGNQVSTEDTGEGEALVKGTGLRTTAGGVGAGTNLDGKCVINVSSSADPASSTARGTHKITVNAVTVVDTTVTAIPGIDAQSVEIQVGGPPSTIESDAPSRIDPSAEVTVKLTVSDDEDVRVGKVTIEVIHTAGDGAIIADTAASTTDGRASFSYIAPSTPGVVEFLVRTKSDSGAVTSQLPIIINIGAEPEEAPDAPPATWSAPIASGTHNLVWNGDDGAAPADGAGEGVTAIWQWNGTGWDGYFPAAADVPGGNTLSSLTNGAAYWVVVE